MWGSTGDRWDCAPSTAFPSLQSIRKAALLIPNGELLSLQTAGTIYLQAPNMYGPSRKIQHWLRQVGVLQRAFPNSILKLDNVVRTSHERNIHRLLNCTELRAVICCPRAGDDRQFWRAVAALGRLHGSRLQLQAVKPDAFWMLEAEPSLAAYVSQANLRWDMPSTPWSAGAGSGLADLVSSLSRLTKLTLGNKDSVLGEAGMLDALRQLSGLQSLHCPGDVMQTLLVNSVPCSWSLLTELQLQTSTSRGDVPDMSLVEQQCPQLQALSMEKASLLCLTALTSLTCQLWRPQAGDSIQCPQLANLHVQLAGVSNLLPSTITSLTLGTLTLDRPMFMANLEDQHLRSQRSVVHIRFLSHLMDISRIQRLIPTILPVLATSVTSVALTTDPQAFMPPGMDEQQFHHLGDWFPPLQRVHIHLRNMQVEGELLISAAWLPAHCRLVVTHKLECPVRVVNCSSGCLSLPLSSWPESE